MTVLAIAVAIALAGACSSSDPSVEQAAPVAVADSDPTTAAETDPPVEPTRAIPPTSRPESLPTPDPTAGAPPTPLPEPTPTPVVEEEPLFELDGELVFTTNELNAMIRFVQDETGRDFLYPPRIEVDTGGSGIALASENAEEDAKARERFITRLRRYQALHITDQSASEVVDVWFGDFASGTRIAGVFDPENDVLMLPEQTSSHVIVHELVHSLDHQHTDLARSVGYWEQGDSSGNYEQALAFRFVVEGRATNVHVAWMRANRGQDFSDAPVGEPIDVPEVLEISFFLPYGQGERFIDRRGGAAETWDLLTNPPAATEQVFVPDTQVEPTVEVAFPPADGPILEQRTFGVIDMVLWPVDGISPVSAAQSWAGGASTLWGDDSETCIRIAIAGDDAEALMRLTRIYSLWAQADDARAVTAEGDRLLITSCAPYVP